MYQSLISFNSISRAIERLIQVKWVDLEYSTKIGITEALESQGYKKRRETANYAR
jgi:hypothetical protein